MTRNEFEIIASVLNECHKDAKLSRDYTIAIDAVILAFSKRLKDINPRFRKDLFIEACVK